MLQSTVPFLATQLACISLKQWDIRQLATLCYLGGFDSKIIPLLHSKLISHMLHVQKNV